MNKVWFRQQSATKLQALCTSCGLTKSGTKAAIFERLRSAARQYQPVPPTARILSIDVGLRNFGYSLLSPAPTLPCPVPSPSDPPGFHPKPVYLHAWHCLDLTSPTLDAPAVSEEAAAEEGEGEEEEEGEVEEMLPAGENDEAFSPTALAARTLELVTTRLLPLQPTHVLIERQRFRSGGGMGVFEWTLRVNTLEAMLHATFAALRSPSGSPISSSSPSWDGQVYSVAPRSISGFLFPPTVARATGVAREARGKGANAVYAALKKEKANMLGRWLATGKIVVPETEQAREMTELYVDRWEKKNGRRRNGSRNGKGKGEEGGEGKKKTQAVVTKVDDLADSVLQGMVWLEWQKNLGMVVEDLSELLE